MSKQTTDAEDSSWIEGESSITIYLTQIQVVQQ